jgi:hypothetical protein
MTPSYDGAERRTASRDLHDRIESIENQLEEAITWRKKIEYSITENTSMTSDIYEIIKMGRGFFKAIGWVGQFLKWAAPIVAVGVAIWTMLKGK